MKSRLYGIPMKSKDLNQPSRRSEMGLAIIEDSLWDTIPKVYRRLNQIFEKIWAKVCLKF